jgi:hypothetical protein
LQPGGLFRGDSENRSSVPTGTFHSAENLWRKLLIPRAGFWAK